MTFSEHLAQTMRRHPFSADGIAAAVDEAALLAIYDNLTGPPLFFDVAWPGIHTGPLAIRPQAPYITPEAGNPAMAEEKTAIAEEPSVLAVAPGYGSCRVVTRWPDPTPPLAFRPDAFALVNPEEKSPAAPGATTPAPHAPGDEALGDRPDGST